MAVDTTLLSALGYPSIPTSGGNNPTGPYIGSSIEGAPSAGFATRNLALADILRQLAGPSFENLYEAGPSDQLARGYKNARQANLSETQRRGLGASGARQIADKGAMQLYAGGQNDVLSTGAAAETARTTGLLQALQALIAQDVAAKGSINSAMNAGRGASAGESAQSLNEILSLAKGSTSIAAMLAGGLLGGAALGATGAMSGTVGGALQGGNIANSLWGGGMIPSYGTPASNTPTNAPTSAPGPTTQAPGSGVLLPEWQAAFGANLSTGGVY